MHGAVVSVRCWLRKTKVSVVKIFSTVYLFNADLDLSGVSTLTNPRHDILGVRFDCKLTFETHVRGVVPSLPKNWYFEDGEWRCCRHLILRCFVITSPSSSLSFSMYYFSAWRSAANCHLQILLTRRAVSGLCPELYACESSSLLYWFVYVIQSSKQSEALSVGWAAPCLFEVLHEVEVPRRRTSQFSWCFPPAQVRMWNDIPC